MRRFRWPMILPFAIPLVLSYIHPIVNENWTVKKFGCGCPPIHDTGGWHFNANHFNLILWGIVLIACITLWYWELKRHIAGGFKRVLWVGYVIGAAVIEIVCVRAWARGGWL